MSKEKIKVISYHVDCYSKITLLIAVLQVVWDIFDSDQDGYISKKELMQVLHQVWGFWVIIFSSTP